MSDTSSMDMGAVTAVTYLGMSMPLSPRSHENDNDSQHQVQTKPDLAPLAEWGIFREEPTQEEKDKEKEKEKKVEEEKKNDDDHAKLEELLE